MIMMEQPTAITAEGTRSVRGLLLVRFLVTVQDPSRAQCGTSAGAETWAGRRSPGPAGKIR